MRTTTSEPATGVLVPVTEPLFTVGERQALAGFLSGYSGLTRDAYALDLRQYTAWCLDGPIFLRADRQLALGAQLRGALLHRGALLGTEAGGLGLSTLRGHSHATFRYVAARR